MNCYFNVVLLERMCDWMRLIYKNVICKNNKKVKYISEMWDCIYLNLI